MIHCAAPKCAQVNPVADLGGILLAGLGKAFLDYLKHANVKGNAHG
jgi:hypothetical protein